jgi:hypothetical protein
VRGVKLFRPDYSSYRGWLYCVAAGSRTGRMKVYRPDGLGWSFDCMMGGGPAAVHTYIGQRIRAGETNFPQLELSIT